MKAGAAVLAACGVALAAGCLQRPTGNPRIIVASLTSGPNNLDPRIGTDDSSQKLHPLIFDNLVELDDHLQIVPKLAERLDHPDPLTYVAILRQGVRFHDGRVLTADDVVYTYRFMLDPSTVSGKKGGYRELASVEALDSRTVNIRPTSSRSGEVLPMMRRSPTNFQPMFPTPRSMPFHVFKRVESCASRAWLILPRTHQKVSADWIRSIGR